MKKYKRIIIFGIIIFIILLIVLVRCITIPNLVLKGSKNIELEYSNEYKELGYEASLFGRNYSNNVKVVNNINYEKLGNYKIEYTVKNQFGIGKKSLIRNIKIVDKTSPVMTLKGSDVILDLYQKYEEPGYTSIDNYDGDITNNVRIENNIDINKVGNYEIKYISVDSSGNKTELKRNVSVVQKNVTSVPILTYHNFMNSDEKKLYKSTDKYTMDVLVFEKQLKYLKENGYNTITLDDFYRWYKGEISLTEKDVVIVIDDGNISSYKYAIPLIEKYGFKATIFVITGRITNYDQEWDASKNKFFNQKIINDIKQNHKSIALESHTHDLHQIINGSQAISVKTKDEISEDFKVSRELLGAEYLAFPYGGNREFTGELLKNNGYKMAFGFGVNGYGLATKNDNQYYIKRVNINAETSMNEFINWLEVR